jgi:hypothetical protein
MKFHKIGCDPINANRQLNLVEQVHQTFTYLATFRSVELLFTLHPNLAPFTVNLGTKAGWDIESNRKNELVGEVFATVNPKNNRKLRNDIEKVAESSAHHKYVFFMCPNCQTGRKQHLETMENVQVWSVRSSL